MKTTGKKATQEQLSIVETAMDGKDMVIKAFAGTGKTSTLCLVANNLLGKRCVYLAFNKAIAEEAKAKFPNTVVVKTTHALAYASVSKTMNLKNVRGDYKPAELRTILGIQDFQLCQAVCLVFAHFCNSDEPQITPSFVEDAADSIIDLAAILNSFFSASEIATSTKAMYSAISSGKIAPTHSFYLKFYQVSGLASKDKFDVILLDESQDTNKVTLDIVKQLNGQKIVVGDDHQKIYGFRGSLNIMELLPNAKVQHLSKSFRFGGNIARSANKILGRFKGETVNIEGVQLEPLMFSREETRTGHLTRTNSQIVKIIVDFVDAGDIHSWSTIRRPEEIFAPSLSIVKFFMSRGIDYFVPASYQWLSQFSSLEELEEYAVVTNDNEMLTALGIAKEHGDRLLNFLYYANMQFGKKDVSNFLSTAHTAKGLEWEEVIIYQDFGSLITKIAEHFSSLKSFLKAQKSPAKSGIDEEINLLYVALTRAKSSYLALFEDAPVIFDSAGHYSDTEVSDLIAKRHEQLKKAKEMRKAAG